MDDRIDVNEEGGYTGPSSLIGAIDDLVIEDVKMVHLEAMSDHSAHLAIYKADGTEVRIWLAARSESKTRRKPVLDMREEF